MKQIILGTAGHIDHGKTSLIKAVTGVDTDRLKEEKLRGITIELGFASLNLPSGQKMGVVDVPGHEKFVKNMVAGATGIDIVALVIAADEGIMPQTREHLEICSLLDIKHGLVVLTKIDMVDEEWMALVQEEVADFIHNTFLENAPVLNVSSTTGQGLDDFIRALDKISARITPRAQTGLFRLPVDRVFSMKGFGTVITGTLLAGTINVGDEIMLYPSGITSKVRGLQVHNQSVSSAQAGMRTAINFQGLDKTAVSRGNIVAKPGTLTPSHMVDVYLNYLPGNTKAVKNRTKVRFHTGTSEIMGIVVLLESEELRPGHSSLAQIRFEEPVSLIRDDRFVLRSYSPVRTIGGGRIINPIPAKHKPKRAEVIDLLTILTGEDVEQIIQRLIDDAGPKGRRFSDLLIMVNLPEKQIEQVLRMLMSRQIIIQIDKDKRRYLHQKVFAATKKMVHDHLAAYHERYPLKPGMPKEELRSRLPSYVDTKLFMMTLQHMAKSKDLVQDEDIVHLASHRIALGDDQQGVRDQIISIYLKGEVMPPYFKEVKRKLEAPADQVDQVMSLLINEGIIIKIKEDLFYHHKPLEQLKTRLTEHLLQHGEITTPQFKEMTGASRKFVIPLIEYFDNIQLTIRVGDIRKLRRQPGR